LPTYAYLIHIPFGRYSKRWNNLRKSLKFKKPYIVIKGIHIILRTGGRERERLTLNLALERIPDADGIVMHGPNPNDQGYFYFILWAFIFSLQQ